MKKTLIAVLLLTGCTTWEPEVGMTYDEFRRQYNTSEMTWRGETIRFVAAQGDTEVYELDDVFYYFVDDVLERADQGQLYEQRIRVTIE